jgi:hypothetical protein
MKDCNVSLFGSQVRIKGAWFPVSISEYGSVRWMKFDSTPLSQPFFESSVNLLRDKETPATETETDLSGLVEGMEEDRVVSPAGIIAHITRCGSTLLLKALSDATGAIALSEAQPISKALQLVDAPSQRLARLGIAIAKQVVTLFASYPCDQASRVVVKCDAMGMMRLRAIRSIWPDVPCLILVRDPIEVVISNLQEPPEWLQPRNGVFPLGFGSIPHDVRGRQDFCAWVIGHLCSEAKISIDDKCKILGYEELTPDIIRSVAEYFSLRYAPHGNDRSRVAFSVHAKYPDRPFVSDIDKKRDVTTDSVVKSIDKWTLKQYNSLMELRLASPLATSAFCDNTNNSIAASRE